MLRVGVDVEKDHVQDHDRAAPGSVPRWVGSNVIHPRRLYLRTSLGSAVHYRMGTARRELKHVSVGITLLLNSFREGPHGKGQLVLLSERLDSTLTKPPAAVCSPFPC